MTPDTLFSDICRILSDGDTPINTEKVRSLTVSRLDVSITAEATERVYGEAMGISRAKYPQVLLCGYYGFGNIGDDALLRASVERSHLELPHASVGALTRRGGKDSSLFGIPCFKRSNSLTLWGKIKRCKRFILGGGTLLQEYTSLRSLAYYCALVAIAKRCGASVYLWGNGLGYPKTSIGAALMKSALKKCDGIGIRDRDSVALARHLAPHSRIYFENDLALSVARAEGERADRLIYELWGDKTPKFIIVAPKRGDGLSDLEKAVAEAVKNSLALCWISMHKNEDTAVVKRMIGRYGGKQLSGVGYADLVALAERSAGVYSMRLHALIAAASAGVPYRAFGSDKKLQTVAEAR